MVSSRNHKITKIDEIIANNIQEAFEDHLRMQLRSSNGPSKCKSCAADIGGPWSKPGSALSLGSGGRIICLTLGLQKGAARTMRLGRPGRNKIPSLRTSKHEEVIVNHMPLAFEDSLRIGFEPQPLNHKKEPDSLLHPGGI